MSRPSNNTPRSTQIWAIGLITVSLLGIIYAVVQTNTNNPQPAPSQQQAIINTSVLPTRAPTETPIPFPTFTPTIAATSTPEVIPSVPAIATPRPTPTISPTDTQKINQIDLEATIEAAYQAYLYKEMDRDATIAAIEAVLENYMEEETCVIKGNISAIGERIYHLPGQRYYDETGINTSKGERWFCSEQEAVNAGWRKSKV
jgi:hypothetical protein